MAGEAFRTGSPVELALALQSPGAVRGYLAMLGAIARSRPDGASFLRALTAPEMDAEEFEEIYAAALAARSACS